MISDVLLFAPEAATLGGALCVFALSVLGAPYAEIWRASLVLACAVAGTAIASVGLSGEPFYPGIYRVDLFSQLVKVGIGVGLLLAVLVAGRVSDVRRSVRVDVPFFLFLSTAGMMMLASATELLTLYVALELSAYGLYILMSLHTAQRRGTEAAVKAVIYGAASSAVTLYGLSFVFGVTGSTYVAEIVRHEPSPLLAIGLLLGLSGFLFKLAVYPFHAWAPDVYEGSPNAIVTFVGTVSKVAAAGAIVRVAALAAPAPGALPPIIFALAVASMTVGNFAALVQKDLKRLLAWSTVAHGGYILVGLTAFSETGFAAVLFYSLVYVGMAFGAFLVVCALGRSGTNPSLDDLRGLHRRAPGLSLVLLVAMFGLAGIPPTPGFAGKWFLFSAALERGQLVLVLVAAINATVSLYYYLGVVKAAFLTPTDDESPVPLGPALRVGAFLSVGMALVLGVAPGPLWSLAVGAARAVMGG